MAIVESAGEMDIDPEYSFDGEFADDEFLKAIGQAQGNPQGQ